MTHEELNRRFNAIKADADTWVPAWKEIQPLIAPHRGYFNTDPNRGGKLDHRTLMNSVAVRANATMAAGMTSGLTSPSRPWFKLGFADPDLMDFNPVKYWLEDTENRMLSVFSRSKIYNNLTSCYEEIGAFSVASMMLLSDFDTVIRGRHFTAGEYFLGQDANGRINTFGRELQMQVGPMVDYFGEEVCSSKVREAYKRGALHEWVTIRHIIIPNAKHQPGLEDSKHMKFASIMWEAGTNEGTILRESGFRSFPVMAPRWALTRTPDIYSRSGPGFQALGDVKMLQKMEKDYMTALALVNKPPVVKDASVTGTVQAVPGGVTIAHNLAPNSGLRPAYQINPNLAAMDAKIARVEANIRAAFFADLFLALLSSDGPQQTAREVIEKHEEKLVVLGPLLESLEGELLEPLIDRSFDEMLEAGLIAPPPAEIQGMALKVEYISPLAQAQKMIGTTALEQSARFIGSVVSVKPEVADIVDWDEMGREHMKMDGVSARVINPPEKVEAIRKARAQAQAAAAAVEQGKVIADGAKVLSETRVGQNSALDAVLGGIAGIPSSQSEVGL